MDQANSDQTSKLTSRLRDFTLQLSRVTGASHQDQIKSARETFIAKQHNAIEQVSFDISSRVQDERTRFLRDTILAWLYFPQVHERRSQIHPAHAKTFSWIFYVENLPRDDAQSNFKQWLEDRHASQNIFWISGKPGSGKSTLMRYLWESPQTRAALSSWSESKPGDLFLLAGWIPNPEVSARTSPLPAP
jgi:DNA replication protein DnaC